MGLGLGRVGDAADRSVGRFLRRGASARIVPRAMNPPPIHSHTIMGLMRTPSVMRFCESRAEISVR